jgi:antitoxin ParD1/3/4
MALVSCGMNKRTSISLETPFSEFIEQQIDVGNYSSASEVVKAGLKLLEEHEAYVAAVRAALIEGEESGPSEPFDFDAFIARKKAQMAK